MDRHAGRLRGRPLAAGEGVGEPVEAGAAGRHAAVRDEQARHQVVVEIEPRVGRRPVGRHQDVDRTAELQEHVGLPRQPRGKGRGDEVGRTADDRRADGEAGLCGRLRRHPAEDAVREGLSRQRRAVDVGERHEVVRDLMRGDVDEAAFECPVLLDGALAGQLPVDVVIGAEDGGDACEDLRLVPLDPAQLGDHQLLVDAVAGAAHEGGRIEFGGEFAHFGAAASVALLDRGSEKLARSVEKHDGGKHAGDADRRDRLGADAARLELGDDGADVRPPLAGIFLRPPRLRRGEGHGARDDADHLVGQPYQNADRRRRADVEAEDAGHLAFILRDQACAAPSADRSAVRDF